MTRRRMQAVHGEYPQARGLLCMCIYLLHNSVINRGGGLVTRPRPLGPIYRTASVTISSSKDCLSLVRIITAYCTVMGGRESRSAPKDDATAKQQGDWKDLYRVSRFDASTDVRSSEYLICSSPPISSTPTPVPSTTRVVPSYSSAAASLLPVSSRLANEH